MTWLAFSLHPLATAKKTYWELQIFHLPVGNGTIAVVVAGEFCPAKRCLDHFLHRERQHLQLAFEVSLCVTVVRCLSRISGAQHVEYMWYVTLCDPEAEVKCADTTRSSQPSSSCRDFLSFFEQSQFSSREMEGSCWMSTISECFFLKDRKLTYSNCWWDCCSSVFIRAFLWIHPICNPLTHQCYHVLATEHPIQLGLGIPWHRAWQDGAPVR